MVKRDEIHNWHVAINRLSGLVGIGSDGWPRFMYEAKDAYQEVPRLALLFRLDREGRLQQEHQQCSRQASEPIPEGNKLSCCLGVECAACPYLRAIDEAEGIAPEAKDEIKAWTCAAHVLMSGGDRAKEGYVLTTSDRMYWGRVYESLTMSAVEGNEGDEEEDAP